MALHAPVQLADGIGDAWQAVRFKAGEEVHGMGGQGGGVLTLRVGGAGCACRAPQWQPLYASRRQAGRYTQKPVEWLQIALVALVTQDSIFPLPLKGCKRPFR